MSLSFVFIKKYMQLLSAMSDLNVVRSKIPSELSFPLPVCWRKSTMASAGAFVFISTCRKVAEVMVACRDTRQRREVMLIAMTLISDEDNIS